MLASIKEDLLKAGQGEGCITFKHLNKLLPDDVKDPGAIEAVFDFLNAHNIEIVTVEDSGRKRTLSGEEWTGKEDMQTDEAEEEGGLLLGDEEHEA